MEERQPGQIRLNRRTLVRAGAAAGVMAAAGHTLPVLADHDQEAMSFLGPRVEPSAGTWRTWVLDSGSELRLGKPPNIAQSRAETAELEALAQERDAAGLDTIAYWNSGAPGFRWNQIAIAKGLEAGIGLRAYRMLVLLNVAIYDATVAAWDTKFTYRRMHPSEFNIANFRVKVGTVIPNPLSPSYPCEYAVTAGAASTILSYLFPDDEQFFQEKAQEAAHSRLVAGVQYPSDVEAGLDLGRAVAERVIERGLQDGSDEPWKGSVPVGPGLWNGDPATLAEPNMGKWQTWALPSGDAVRPDPPPTHDSQERLDEIAEVKNYPRDNSPFTELSFWPGDPSGRPVPDSVPHTSSQAVLHYAPFVQLIWFPELNQKIAEYRLDLNTPRAARAYALVSIAGYDATVAAWEGKFFYWTARPNQFDPAITSVVPTYPIPDYPSGHAATLSGAGEMMAYLFPRDAHYFRSMAMECAISRVWAGIHFRSASEVGVTVGADAAAAAISIASQDGSDSGVSCKPVDRCVRLL